MQVTAGGGTNDIETVHLRLYNLYKHKWEIVLFSLLSDLYTEISNMRTGLIACFFQ